MTSYDSAYYVKLLEDAFATIFAEGDHVLDEDGVPIGLRRSSERYYAPDCTFRVPGKGPYSFSGGKADWYAAVAKQMTEARGSWRHEIEHVLADSERGLVLVNYTASDDRSEYQWRRANVYRFTDGLISEVIAYEADQYDFDRATSALRADVADS